MVCTPASVEFLSQKLLSFCQEQATGKLVVSSQGERWQFYLLGGQFLYITGDRHRVRRWSRALQQHSPDFEYDAKEVAGVNLWEYQLLYKGVARGQLSLKRAKLVLSTIIGEIFFTILGCKNLKLDWIPARQQPDSQNPSTLALSGREIEHVFRQSVQLRQKWQEMGLNYLCADRAPVWKKSPAWKKRLSPDCSVHLTRLFNGQNTFWDMAMKKKRSVLEVTRTLHHFIQQDEIGLRMVQDMPSPIEQLSLVNAAVTPDRPLIACIDDSVTISQSLRKILVPAGYRVLSIQDPLAEMPTLVKQKPDLILLDLIMPQLNGTDFCGFLRKTTIFKEIPIVILTSSDGVVDRVRANLNGASDFLSKPPEPSKVLQTISKYLANPNPSRFSLNSDAISGSTLRLDLHQAMTDA